jgi:hypothetical protein
MAVDPLKIAIKGTTQEHLPIEDIVNGVVLMKDGSCAIVLRVSSVNFDLLSEREQSALVFAYGGILNSLNFAIQIIVQTSTKDITSYIGRLKEVEDKQTNPMLKDRIASYKRFIEETVKKNDVLSKMFYIAIPFSTLELGIKEASGQLVSSFNPLNKIKKDQGLPFTKEYIIEKAKANLEPKKDHLIRLFSRLGLEIRPLDTKELIQLFYKIYNDETANYQKVQSMGFDAPMVTTK